MRFDFADLRLFLHVAEAESITRGSERANLALASASARIRGMEEALGVDLLRRGRRGVSLTPAGQCLVDHARLLMQQMERMRGELGAFARGLAGSVRVLSNAAAFGEHLPRRLASFLAANPTLDVDLEERESIDIVEAIASGAADIGIAIGNVSSDAIETFPFRTDRLVLVATRSDPLSKRRSVSLSEVIHRDFVGLARESALQRHLAGHVARLGATMKLRVRVNGFDAVCRMVEAGVGLGIVPEAAAKRCKRSMRICAVQLKDAWAERNLVICIGRSRTLSRGAEHLLDHLRRDARSP